MMDIGKVSIDIAWNQCAHVCVGISIQKCMQDVNSENYAIQQFHFLDKLILQRALLDYIRMAFWLDTCLQNV